MNDNGVKQKLLTSLSYIEQYITYQEDKGFIINDSDLQLINDVRYAVREYNNKSIRAYFLNFPPEYDPLREISEKDMKTINAVTPELTKPQLYRFIIAVIGLSAAAAAAIAYHNTYGNPSGGSRRKKRNSRKRKSRRR